MKIKFNQREYEPAIISGKKSPNQLLTVKLTPRKNEPLVVRLSTATWYRLKKGLNVIGEILNI